MCMIVNFYEFIWQKSLVCKKSSFDLLGSSRDKAPVLPCGDPWDREVPSLESIIPMDTGTAYNMLDVINGEIKFSHQFLCFMIFCKSILIYRYRRRKGIFRNNA